MTIADNIKTLREHYGLTQGELGEIAGVTDKAVSTWERGEAAPRLGAVEKMAKHFGLPKSAIIDDEDPTIPEHKGMIPLYGAIPAGPEHWTSDDPEDWIRYEPDDPGQYFALRVHGDSMAPTLMDGDLVFVLSDAEIHTGDIAVIRINGTEKTMKEVQVMDNGIMLVGHNTNAYTPHFYSAEEVESLPIVFEGKVVALKREF